MKNKKPIFFTVIIVSLSMFFAAKSSGLSDDDKERAVKRLTYRQEEFFNRWDILNSREMKAGTDLNDAITMYNQSPSPMALQRIDDLKIKLIENLQDQVINDRDYISYLELMLSEFLDFDFSPLELNKIPEDNKS